MDNITETVPCKYCGAKTEFTETKLCNECLALDTLIRANFGKAKRILRIVQAELKKGKKP